MPKHKDNADLIFFHNLLDKQHEKTPMDNRIKIYAEKFTNELCKARQVKQILKEFIR